MINYKLFHLIFFLSTFCLITFGKFCQTDDGNCGIENEINKYSRDVNVYLNNIMDALEAYTPCQQTNCSCHYSRIVKDLEPWKHGITKSMLDGGLQRGTKYQIIDHKLYRQRDCLFPARCSGVEHFIRENIAKLPNMEMIINCRDWPQVNRNWQQSVPVFSFSKTAEYLDIMYPAWSFWEGGPAISLYPTGLGRWDQHRNSIRKAASSFQWAEKFDKAFFRGSRTSDERDNLILLSRQMPDLVDAQFTKNQAWKSMRDTLNAVPAKEIPLEDHCKYRFLFNFRGVAASFRLKHLFLCKSLIFHVGDEWQEFFYDSLKPWVHYVPVDPQASVEELKQLIEFFQKHNELAEAIAQRGFDHIWNHLRMADVHCYWRRLLRKYSKLLRFEVIRDSNLIEI